MAEEVPRRVGTGTGARVGGHQGCCLQQLGEVWAVESAQHLALEQAVRMQVGERAGHERVTGAHRVDDADPWSGHDRRPGPRSVPAAAR